MRHPSIDRRVGSYAAAGSRVQPPPHALQIIVFAAGVLLPLVSLVQEGSRTAQSVLARVVPVDLVILVLILSLFFSWNLRHNRSFALYLCALVFSLGVALVASRFSSAEVASILTSFVALAMALTYCVVGVSVGASPVLTRALVAGLAIGVGWESVIALHDYSASSQWFPELMAGRVRGTFRASGQLGAFGFSAAGILLGFGWTMWSRRRTRMFVLVAGILGVFLVFAASRRSGIFALACWLAIYLFMGVSRGWKRTYVGIVAATLTCIVVLRIYVSELSDTFFFARLLSATSSIEAGGSTPQRQLVAALGTMGSWFPLGLGVGRGHTIPGMRGEIHNGHLALLVEAGVFGLIAFYAVVLRAIRRPWAGSFGQRSALVRSVVVAFVLASAIFMVHNRLHRDRGFMLFIGLASSIGLTVHARSRPTAAARRAQAPAAIGAAPPIP